jgi:hypothetical protein
MGKRGVERAGIALAEMPLKRYMDQRLIDAISHPARAHVLATLNERIASPSEVAEEIGVDVKYLNYHFEELQRNDCIELVRTERCRGATKHYYRAKRTICFSNREWANLPASLRGGFSTYWLQAIARDATKALERGTFDARCERHLSWTPRRVDEQGWRDINAVLDEALDRILAISGESAERLEREGGSGIRISVAMTGFESPLDEGDPIADESVSS